VTWIGKSPALFTVTRNTATVGFWLPTTSEW
jgi:hypothetical protein